MSIRIRKPTFRANLRRRPQQNGNSITLIPPDVVLSFLTDLITPVSDTILSLSLPPPPAAITTPPSDLPSSIQVSMVVSEMSNNNTDDQLIPKLSQEIQDVSLVVGDDSSFILVNTQVRPYIDLIEIAKCHLKNNKISYATNPTDESHENITDDDDDIIVID